MDPIDSLAVARIAIGAAAWTVPTRSFGLLRLDGSVHTPYVARMFAAREVALGAVTLLAGSEHKAALAKLGVAVDAADTAAGLLALRGKAISPIVGVGLTAASLGAVVTGVAVARRKG